VVSASLGQLSAMRADKPEGAGYGAEAFAYAGSNEIFDGGSSEPLVRFSRSGIAVARRVDHFWIARPASARCLGAFDPCGPF
jgi:hypothetical protein